MYRTLFALLIGITLPSYLAKLLPLLAFVTAVPVLLLAWLLARRFCYKGLTGLLWLVLLFVLGLGWGSYSLHSLLNNQLHSSLEGQDIFINGVIEAPLQHSRARLRMQLKPDPVVPDTLAVKLPQRLQVSWYRAPEWTKTLAQGDRVALKVRLKRPRSFVNPVGFDYKLWQLRRGIGAVGYVRPDPGNKRLEHNKLTGPRVTLSAWLQRQAPVNNGLIRALLLGERGELSGAQRQLLQSTGTSHLIAISGLHIGLAASFGYLLALALGKLLAPLLPWRAHLLAYAGAALAAWGYSALAGFSLPTQRALVMLLLLYLMRVLGRHCGGGLILAAAAVVVCGLDPLSVRDAGFWLSFLAVGSLILVYDGVLSPARRWQSLWLPQLVVFVALLLPLAAFFAQVSLVSPLANVVAIPLVSLLVVPLLFAAALCSWLSDTVAAGLLWLADRVLDGFWWWLHSLAQMQTDYGWPISVPWQPQPLALLLVGLGALALLLPKEFKLRIAGLLLVLLALWLPAPKEPNLALTVMDVGQGLAVVVQTKNRSLVYDTGLRYSDSFNAGADIVAPWLRHTGVQELDILVVSHAHADHYGGVAGLLQTLPVNALYLGEPLSVLKPEDAARARSCHGKTSAAEVNKAAPQWRWGEVAFTFLALPGQNSRDSNSASCVLLIEYRGYRILLPGDIEAPLEPQLVTALAAQGVTKVDTLVAPHHGSKSSSSRNLVMSLRPDKVIFSAGYNNRYGHPHAQVVGRYQQVGAQLFNTAYDGAVSLHVAPDGTAVSRAQRQLQPRPWRD